MGAQLDAGHRSSHQLNVRLLRFRVQPEREEPVLLAQDLISSGRADEALGVTHAALQADPGDADLLLAHGMSWLSCGELSFAQRALIGAARVAPGWTEPWRRLGELLMLRKQYDRAIDVADRALSLDGEDPELRILRLEAARLSGVDARLAAFDRDPASEDGALLARELMSLDRSEEAFAVVGEALLHDPEDEDLLMLQAQAHEARGELCSAQELLERLTTCAPDWREAWLRLGEVKLNRGELEAEGEDRERVVERWVERMTAPPPAAIERLPEQAEAIVDRATDELLMLLENDLHDEELQVAAPADEPGSAQADETEQLPQDEIQPAIAADREDDTEVELVTEHAEEPILLTKPARRAADTTPGTSLSPRAAWALRNGETSSEEAASTEPPAQSPRTSWVLEQSRRPRRGGYRPPRPSDLRPRAHPIHTAMDRAWSYLTGR